MEKYYIGGKRLAPLDEVVPLEETQCIQSLQYMMGVRDSWLLLRLAQDRAGDLPATL